MRSPSERTSPWTKRTPAAFRRGRFNSLPRRRKLSNAITAASGYARLTASASVAPTNPAPPVTKTVSGITRRGPFRGSLDHSTMIVAAGKVLFEPQVEDDKQISAPHFLNLQLGDSS